MEKKLLIYKVDVYKRQPYDSVAIIIEKLTHQKIPFHKARILSDVVVVIIGIIFAIASGAGIWSVSYTHLDVYKRQTVTTLMEN